MVRTDIASGIERFTRSLSAPNSLFYLLGIAVLFLLFSSNKALSFESTEISGKHFESTQSTEILFVDYRVSDQEVLLSELRENTEVVFLNADSPGIEQIAAALKGRGKVAALHVLSHGAPGSVLIGSDQLNLAALTSSASGSVKKIGEYIASDADILFYGCEAGKGRVGRRFVDALAAATGADIAASETLVGAKRLGGNWNLEVSQGEVEINSFISPRAAAHYSHALPTFTFNTASVAGGELTETKSGVTLTVSNTSGSVSIRSVSSGSDSGSSTALYPNASASATTTYAFSQTVDVSAFKIFTLSDARYRLTPIGGSGPTYGYDGGSPGSYPYAKTSGVSWSGISGFTIDRTDSAAASQYAMVSLTFSIVDSDGSLTAASGVAEPVALPTTVDTIGEALDVFDFTLTDGGTADALALGVSQVVVNVSGTATDAQRSQITWRLNGPDASNVTGTYSAGADTLTFSGLSISVADGASEVYTVNAYFNDNTSLTDNATVILSVDGDTDLTVLGTGTSMAATTAVTNGTGTLTTVAATIMVYAPEPAGSSSGSALTTQPIVRALDAAGNLDTDFIETVTLSSTGSGTLSGDIDIAAVGGVATFSGVIYSAAVDRESIVFSADDEAVGIDLAAITSSAISSEVTATRLVFQVQPSPRFAYSGSSITFASAITVAAVDAIGAVDADFTGSVVLSEVGGAGATEIIFAADTDGDITTATMSAVAGVASFSGLSSAYSSGTEGDEVYFIAANSAAFAEVRSESLSSSPAPPPVDPTIRDKVTRTGTSTDPEIAEGGELTGGEVGGEITGDPEDPAMLSGVTVLPGSRLSNVNIGADVILLKGVIIGDNVGFASFLNMPSGVALTNTLSFIAVPGREGQTALDLRGESIAGAATAPRTSYLDLVAEVPEFEEPGAAIKQQPQGEIEMEFSDSEARMVPIRITKTDTPDADEVGFSYDDDGNLSIRLPSLLEIIMYPMFTDDDALLAAIKKEDPAYGLKYGADSYFEITKDTETGLAATLPRYVGRPGLSAVKLASGTERELGFFTYPSPFLANVNAVSLITRNDVGALMEQEMVPAPSDWLLFKTRVLKEGRVSRVSIDPRGVITIRETAGYEFRVLADYAVIPNAVFSKEGRPIVFINAGDLNANGEDDYYSYYPNGDRQTLYVFPQ